MCACIHIQLQDGLLVTLTSTCLDLLWLFFKYMNYFVTHVSYKYMNYFVTHVSYKCLNYCVYNPNSFLNTCKTLVS